MLFCIVMNEEHMLDLQYTRIEIKRIDLTDRSLCWFREPELTKEQLEKAGIMQPVWLQEAGAAYRVVNGFDRVRAAGELGLTTLPAMIFPESIPYPRLFELVMRDRLERGPLKPMEIVHVLNSLRDSGFPEKEIVSTFLPLMGMGRNPRILELHRNLEQLEAEWQTLLDEDGLAIDLASQLLKAPQPDRNAFLQLVKDLRLNKNRQREFWGLVRDVARIQKVAVPAVLESDDIRGVLAKELLTVAQKTDLVKGYLWQVRYPEYSGVRDRYETILKTAKLPPEITIASPPFFDGERYTVSFSFASAGEFHDHLARLQHMYDEGLIEEIFNLV